MDLCKDRGVLLGKGGLFGNVIRIAPPLSITKDEINHMLKVIEESLVELTK
jgi:alanine-glyoxylate transaminase/(R)-3-amino-2-methylpropionate-pyruvate transaminase